jgi:DNA polymerase I
MRIAIDAGSLIWPAFTSKLDGSVLSKVLYSLNDIKRLYEGTTIAIAVDDDQSIRRERFPAYKANRPPKPEGFAEEQRRVLRYLSRECRLGRKPGWEADDVLADWALGEWKDDPVLLVSSDKDLLSLVDARVHVYSPYHRREFMRPQVKEKHGVWPEQMVDFLAIAGDRTDGIPGLPGMGVVKAQKLLEKHGTADAALAAGDIGPEHTENLNLYRWLIKLCPKKSG